MRTFLAFLKKELLCQLRTGKVLILGVLFVLFGIMNPAVAKLTPWLLEAMGDALEESGMVITSVTVSAMDSWVQFFKNMPMALIAFVILQSNIFTKEYQTGTLLLSLTKGLARCKVVLAKLCVLTLSWTAGYWLCFGINYACNSCFWDNSVAQNLLFSVLCWWVFGLWIIGLLTLLSTIFTGNAGVLLGTGGVAMALYLIGLIPKLGRFLPTGLTSGSALIYGAAQVKEYAAGLVITAILLVLFPVLSIPLFQKKQL